jgi:hypothetical protein
MKFVKYSAVLALVAFTLSLGAFAKDKSNNEGKFTLGDTAQVGSTQLKPGDYKAVWDGTGPDVQVKILQGKNVVATTSAKLVDKSYAQDAVTLGPGSGGVKTLDEVDFGSRNKALVFGSATTAQN